MKNPFKKLDKSANGENLGQIVSLPVDQLIASPRQPRRTFDLNGIYALAESIRIHGILQPISDRRIDHIPARKRFAENDWMPKPPEETSYRPDKPRATRKSYEIISGERRFRAAQLLGMHEVPCLILNCSEKQSAELSLIQVVQHEELHPLEEAAAIASLIQLCALSQEQIARRMSVTPAYVANKLKLLRLGAQERDLIMTHRLSERHARIVARLESEEARIKLLRRIISQNLNPQQAEEMARTMRNPSDQVKNSDKFRSPMIRDARLCYNTIEHAIESVAQMGVEVIRERHESEDAVEYVIRFPKRRQMPELLTVSSVFDEEAETVIYT